MVRCRLQGVHRRPRRRRRHRLAEWARHGHPGDPGAGRRRARPGPGRARLRRRRRRRPRPAQRERRRTRLRRGGRRPPPPAGPGPAPRRAGPPRGPTPPLGRLRRRARRRGRRPARRPAHARLTRGVGGQRRRSPAPPPARCSSPSPCSSTSAGSPGGWPPRSPSSCSPSRVRRSPAGSPDRSTPRQRRPVGHAAGARRPHRHRRRARAVRPCRHLSGRLRVEALVRRADLVSQLRFAVTMQDLRTVVLLRRQLRGERPRNRPGSVVDRVPPDGRQRRPAGWRRRPTPVGRSGSAAGGACCATRWPGSCAWRSSSWPPASPSTPSCGGPRRPSLGVGGALYLLGLDAVEPLSQEIDHPDHTDAMPRRGAG